MAMGLHLERDDNPDRRQFAEAFALGVDAIRRRGNADVGEKTMLDVLIPISRLLLALADEDTPLNELCAQLKAESTRRMLATKDMIATKGRASFLGERAIGHIDPGCKTCEVVIASVCDTVLLDTLEWQETA
jgi:dihydroxyacetone kinase-like protein